MKTTCSNGVDGTPFPQETSNLALSPKEHTACQARLRPASMLFLTKPHSGKQYLISSIVTSIH